MLKSLISSELTACSKELFSKLDSIARTSGLITRRSKHFSAQGFLLTMLKAALSGKASFNQLAMTLGLSELKSSSRQALHKRINSSATNFMCRVITHTMAQRWKFKPTSREASCQFGRVIVEDSSQRPLPAVNHPDFPAHGNGHGVTSGCKFDLCFDLKTGEPIDATLHLATTQDREIGPDLVDAIQPNDLVLRDMGYFSIEEFARIESKGAFWVSRLPATTGVVNKKGAKLETLLRRSKQKQIECNVRIGAKGHKVRLVAIRATTDVAEQRRRKRKEAARKQGRTPSADSLLRDGWHIILSNIGEQKMEAEELFELYAQRWQIEIVFRAWKQSGRGNEALKRHSNPFHIECLMLASLWHLVLTMKVAGLAAAVITDLSTSIEKLADSLASHIMAMSHVFELSQWDPDPRHLALDRRKTRQNLFQRRVSCLG